VPHLEVNGGYTRVPPAWAAGPHLQGEGAYVASRLYPRRRDQQRSGSVV